MKSNRDNTEGEANKKTTLVLEVITGEQWRTLRNNLQSFIPLVHVFGREEARNLLFEEEEEGKRCEVQRLGYFLLTASGRFVNRELW